MKMNAIRSAQVCCFTTLAVFLCSCGKDQNSAPSNAQVAAASPAATQTSAFTSTSLAAAMIHDADTIKSLQQGGPLTGPDDQAIADAKAAIEKVNAAQVIADRDQKTANEAKAVYTAKTKTYQLALSDSNSAKQAAVKAASSLTAAQQDLNSARAAVNAAQAALDKVMANPKATPQQKTDAKNFLTKANARADQAASLIATRTAALEAAQKNADAAQNAVAPAAEAATQAQGDYSSKAA
ncbi:MAG: hypothetical protein ACXWTJ_23180, partial [Bdellovibrionota bacterium]